MNMLVHDIAMNEICLSAANAREIQYVDPRFLIPLDPITNYDDIRAERYTRDMAENGFDPKHPIECVYVDGMLFVKDGHHRMTAARRNELSRVAIKIIAANDEIVDGIGLSARSYARSEIGTVSKVYDWEGAGSMSPLPDIYYERIICFIEDTRKVAASAPAPRKLAFA